MILSKKQAEVLELKTAELKVLKVLEEALNITQIAEKTDIPRTSLNYMLSKLKSRGLAKRQGKLWVSVTQQELSYIFRELYEQSLIVNDTDEHKIHVSSSRNTGVILYHGHKNMISLYRRMLKLNKHERLSILQPNQSTELVLKKFPLEELNEINRYIQQNGVIVEAVLHENAIPHYFETLKKTGKTNETLRDIAQSLTNRTADTTYIPKELLTFKSELYIMDDIALILNWDQEMGIEIKNQDMVGLLKQLFEFVKSHGKKVDQNPIIQDVLKSFALQAEIEK